MDLKFVITEDGSHTLAVSGMNEHYHSVHGAISESQHIFINAGLKHVIDKKQKINILEIGFGTGLNALLTLIETSKLEISCEYTAIEAYPLAEDIYNNLNYQELLNIQDDLFLKIHQCEWNKNINISKNFNLQKKYCQAQKMILASNHFDLVYFDAFAPDIQPEMWDREIFENIFLSMKKGAILTTYSTKGEVKRKLKEIGFAIEKLKGPKGKREILRAEK